MDEYYKSVVNISDLFDRAFEGSAAIVGNPVASKTKYIIYCTGLKKNTNNQQSIFEKGERNRVETEKD